MKKRDIRGIDGSFRLVLATIIISILCACLVAAQEEASQEVELTQFVMGWIGFFVGVTGIVFGIKLLVMTQGSTFQRGIAYFIAGLVMLSIASILCFLGWVSGMFSDEISVFIEDQLRLLSLVCWMIGLYVLHRGFN